YLYLVFRQRQHRRPGGSYENFQFPIPPSGTRSARSKLRHFAGTETVPGKWTHNAQLLHNSFANIPYFRIYTSDNRHISAGY
uniref:hypothetical protein n=1 Tax=Brunnivagina elsteri TaxID=1247191 RepID=UPI001B80D7B3